MGRALGEKRLRQPAREINLVERPRGLRPEVLNLGDGRTIAVDNYIYIQSEYTDSRGKPIWTKAQIMMFKGGSSVQVRYPQRVPGHDVEILRPVNAATFETVDLSERN